MKKVLSNVLIMLVLVSMTVMLTGCGDKSKFVGEWTAKLDLTESYNDVVASTDPELAEYLLIEEFSVVLNFKFNEDGTYSLEGDKVAFEDTLGVVEESFREGMTEYLEDVIVASGLNMTVDQMLAASETTMDELIEDIFSTGGFSTDLLEGLQSEGRFKVESGKLYLTDDTDSQIDKSVYDKYEIVNENEIKLIEGVGGDEGDEEFNEITYPLTLTRK